MDLWVSSRLQPARGQPNRWHVPGATGPAAKKPLAVADPLAQAVLKELAGQHGGAAPMAQMLRQAVAALRQPDPGSSAHRDIGLMVLHAVCQDQMSLSIGGKTV